MSSAQSTCTVGIEFTAGSRAPRLTGKFPCYKNNFLTLHTQDPSQHLLVFADAICNGECSLIAFPPRVEKQTTVDGSPAGQWCHTVPRWLAFLLELWAGKSVGLHFTTEQTMFCGWFQIASHWQRSPQWTTASRLTDGAKHRRACSEIHILELIMQAHLGVSDPGLLPCSSIPTSHIWKGEPGYEIQREWWPRCFKDFYCRIRWELAGEGEWWGPAAILRKKQAIKQLDSRMWMFWEKLVQEGRGLMEAWGF